MGLENNINNKINTRGDISNENKVDSVVIVEQKRIDSLWKRFNLCGRPLKVGTPVMSRLLDTCQSYLNILTNIKVSNTLGSDNYRRELHNQIAFMVDGRSRSNMDSSRAEEIAEFASYLVYKVSISQLEEIINIK